MTFLSCRSKPTLLYLVCWWFCKWYFYCAKWLCVRLFQEGMVEEDWKADEGTWHLLLPVFSLWASYELAVYPFLWAPVQQCFFILVAFSSHSSSWIQFAAFLVLSWAPRTDHQPRQQPTSSSSSVWPPFGVQRVTSLGSETQCQLNSVSSLRSEFQLHGTPSLSLKALVDLIWI